VNAETCETRVGNRLVNWLQLQPQFTVLSYHPTSAKAYQTELIRIPRLDANGTRTKERYHVDVIFLTSTALWLVELKCRTSESIFDIAKLREIRTRYTLPRLLSLIRSRLTSAEPELLSTVQHLYIALGVEFVDACVPDDVSVFVVTDNGVALTGRYPLE
jgi:hypothetical protein